MVWDDKHKIIFVHLPKTGGTSIEVALNLQNKESGYGLHNKKKAMQHFTWKEYKNYIGDEKYDKYYKFAISRNPYEKVISDFYWLTNFAKLKNKNNQIMTFNEYLDHCEYIIKNNLYHLTIYNDHFMPQHKFIYDDNNNLMIDKILRFENFDYIKKFMKLRYKVNINHLNKNKEENKIIFDEEQKNKIYNMLKTDFILLKYPK